MKKRKVCLADRVGPNSTLHSLHTNTSKKKNTTHQTDTQATPCEMPTRKSQERDSNGPDRHPTRAHCEDYMIHRTFARRPKPSSDRRSNCDQPSLKADRLSPAQPANTRRATKRPRMATGTYKTIYQITESFSMLYYTLETYLHKKQTNKQKKRKEKQDTICKIMLIFVVA